MTEFTKHTLETAAPEARAVLGQVKENYGFVPNLMASMVEAPQAARAYLALGDLFGETSFTATEQQVILLAVSRYNDCRYCVAAHSSIAELSKVPVDVVNAIRDDQPIADVRLEALRQFATRVVDQRGWLSDEQVAQFLDAGYGQQQILEVVLGVAMKTISNYTNHFADTELDSAFRPKAWQPTASNVA